MTLKVQKPKPPILIASGDTTIRIDPPSCQGCVVHVQVMRPPQYDNEGKLEEPGSFYNMYLNQNAAKLFADALHAQTVMELME